ncbi:hypothetical protein [Peterkaempfera bronchialis]|uniref:hypothetical protein n=1 Tax=Peterkaempfera bronchialis TaxID=2126346 RepID=UPI001E3E9DD8|nr:hypothetical protein [Peterkaempfera bronchialis]
MVVLVGEGQNDREVLRILLEAFNPDLKGRIVTINDKIPLRDATGDVLHGRVTRLAGLVRARAAREGADIAAVFVHEDFDQRESAAADQTRSKVQAALSRQLGETASYILIAWEVEAWMLLFPDALTAFKARWSVPRARRHVNTGLIDDPKRVMVKEVARAGPPYRESDAPAIFEKVVALSHHTRPAGTNRSWELLVQLAASAGTARE